MSADAVPGIPPPAPSGFIPGRVSCGPHAGHAPPAEACRCGGRKWWRSAWRASGWRCCACCGGAAPGEKIVVREMPAPPTLAAIAAIAAPAPSAPPPEAVPPVFTGRVMPPPGAHCAACGSAKWWISRTHGAPTWLCCRCVPFSPGATAALPTDFLQPIPGDRAFPSRTPT
ncbi:MAG TPA: hypothetical protein VMF62_13475 [Acetobacteraceae bacterium]|nr:hypothetical protein [Acetobacteraceae bacterium]